MINSFKKEEIIKIKGKDFPLIGGRLRLAHEENKNLNIETNLISFNPDIVIIQALVKTEKGLFNGLGNASIKRDKIFSNAIIELAETRAIARALRFAGYGVEYTGFEEIDEKVSLRDNEKADRSILQKIFEEAKLLDISQDELQELVKDNTGKIYSRELSNSDAFKVLDAMREIKKEKDGVHGYKNINN